MGTTKQLPLCAAAALVALWTTEAHATASYMETDGATSQPVGHYEFCQRHTDECQQRTPASAPVEMTRELWSELIDTNNAVNTEVEPRTDMELLGVEEYWSYPQDGFGDCEDYVLEKRRRLMEAGVPAGNLLVTVVRQPNGDGHAVLTVHTSLGDFVLDNLKPRVKPWRETEYRFLKRQSTRDSGRWVSVDDGRSVAVGSVSSR